MTKKIITELTTNICTNKLLCPLKYVQQNHKSSIQNNMNLENVIIITHT